MATTNIQINGVIDTSDFVLDNINRIADASLSFVTWNLETGKWSVIVKEPTASGRTFDDSNIVGSITVGGTGIEQTYSSATIRFPHKDLNSDSDYVTVQVSSGERYPNEIDNNLEFETSLTNDPVQAQQMANIELKQSRIDQIIEFSTDYSNLGVTAGEIITVNSSQYGYNSKLFRVISVKEVDSEDGMLLINIIAEEYINIYTNVLSRGNASKKTNIVPRAACQEFKDKDSESISNAVADSLNTNTGRDNLTKDVQVGNSIVSIPLFQTEQAGWGASEITAAFGGGTLNPGSITATWATYRPIKTCYVTFESAQGDCVFDIDGVDKTFTALGIPTYVIIRSRPFDVNADQGVGSFAFRTIRYMEWSSYFTQISLDADEPTEFKLEAYPLTTYDLNTNNNPIVLKSASNFIANADGEYATMTVAAFLN